jgi:hypothetical protein
MKPSPEIFILVLLLAVLFTLSYAYRNPGVCMIDPMLEKLRQDLIKVDPRLGKLQYFPGNESYTEDKEKIFICMKDEQGNYYPYNALLQVALHEAAHALCPIVDTEHKTPEFNNLHNALRKKASALGLVDLTKNVPLGYCPKH